MKLYFCDIPNFGDALNRLLFERVFGIRIVRASFSDAEAVGIGSILDDFLYKKRQYLFLKAKNLFPLIANKKPLLLLSSGFGFDCYRHPVRSKKYLSPRSLKRRIVPIVFRGKHTQNQMSDILGESFDKIPVGDGGLLSSEVCDFKSSVKSFSLGIVPHYADAQDPVFGQILETVKNSTILDTRKPVLEFMRDISQCEVVASTAMHPLIACDSFGIPNLWLRISETTTSRYKFADYYSALGIDDMNPLCIKSADFSINKNFPEFVACSYRVSASKIYTVKREIYSAMKCGLSRFFIS